MSAQPAPKAVLFDLDGTLVDTAPDLGHAANLIRQDLGLPPLPLQDYRPVASAGARGLLGKALGIGPEHPDFPAHRERFLALYRAHLSFQSRVFPGIDALLLAMEQAGMRWGVVTNKPAWLTDPLLEDLRLNQRSACAICPDHVARAKPAPDSLLHAAALLQLPVQDCWYVGDDKRDIDAARAAGMFSIAADWGYLGDAGPIESWQADRIARSPDELRSWLR